MEGPQPLEFDKQLDLFISRGMRVKNRDRAIKHIQDLGYYKIKEFSLPFFRTIDDENGEKTRKYFEVSFQDVLDRYYSDKNLRIALLHSIEDIEVSIKTKIAYILGKKGACYYLNFPSWCNRNEYCKYYLDDKQKSFKRKIKERIYRSNSAEIKDKRNLKDGIYPTIWLLVEVLTFGDIVEMLELMSESNLRKLANYYNCTPKELVSWLKSLKFIRNNCAHNSTVIDIQLKTRPVLLSEWDDILYKNSKNGVTNRLALVLCINNKLMVSINESYNFSKIYGALNSLLENSSNPKRAANLIGFKDEESINKLFPRTKKNTKKNKYKSRRS